MIYWGTARQPDLAKPKAKEQMVEEAMTRRSTAEYIVVADKESAGTRLISRRGKSLARGCIGDA